VSRFIPAAGISFSSFISERSFAMILTNRFQAARTAALTGLVLTAGLIALPTVHAQTFDFTQSYAYTGGLQTFVDPAGVTSIFTTLSGGGGGGFVFSNAGGSGALVSGYLPVTPGTTYDILVGGGGNTDGYSSPTFNSSSAYGGGGIGGDGYADDGTTGGGGGGGRSAIQNTQGVDLVDAGGGGGGPYGGNGGFNGGNAPFLFPGSGIIASYGGSQTAGGAGANPGVGHQGGNGASNGFISPTAGGGGGGGGYYGGGGGNAGGPSGGGGGGSSLLPNSTFTAISGGGGAGGVGPSDIVLHPTVLGTNGANGFVTIQYNSPAAVPEMSSAVGLGVCLLGMSLLGLHARRRSSAVSV
jgi:hypothetical protein